MSRPLRIASFNLEDFGGRSGAVTPLDQRIAVLRPMLLALDADILCLQEVNAQEVDRHGERRLLALDRLVEGTPLAGFERAVSHGLGLRGPADLHNLVTLSRPPIAEHRQLRHELVAPPLYRPVTAIPQAKEAQPVEWDRPILYTTHAVEGGVLHVVNVHLRAPLAAMVRGQKLSSVAWRSTAGWAEGFFLAAVKRAGQALEARLLVDRIFDAELEALIAVCGDYNAELAETPLRAVRADPGDTHNPDLAARALMALEAEIPPGQRFSVLHSGRPVMLDHLLVSTRLQRCCRGVEVLNRDLADEVDSPAAIGPPRGSFHAPIVAAFELG